jgi:hypothetical protein
MSETIIIDVDDEFTFVLKTHKKVVINVNHKVSRDLGCKNAMGKAHF